MFKKTEVDGLFIEVEENPVIAELFFAGFRKAAKAVLCVVCGQPGTKPRRELIETTPLGAVYATYTPGELKVYCEQHEPKTCDGSGTERYPVPKSKPATWANADFDEDGFPLGADGQPYFPGRSY